MDAPEGVPGHVRRRLPQDVELAGVLHVVELVTDAVARPATPCPARARLRPAGGGRLRRTRRYPSAAHYRRPGLSPLAVARPHRPRPPGERSGEARIATRARHAHLPPRSSRARPHRPDGRRMALARPLPRRRARRSGRIARGDDRAGPARAGRARASRRAVPHALRPASSTCGGPRAGGPARGGGAAGPGPAPGGRRRPLHRPHAGPGPGARAGQRRRQAAVGPGRGLAGRRASSSPSSCRPPGSSCRSGPARTAPTPCSTCSPPSAAGCGASSSGPRTSAARSVPLGDARSIAPLPDRDGPGGAGPRP